MIVQMAPVNPTSSYTYFTPNLLPPLSVEIPNNYQPEVDHHKNFMTMLVPVNSYSIL